MNGAENLLTIDLTNVAKEDVVVTTVQAGFQLVDSQKHFRNVRFGPPFRNPSFTVAGLGVRSAQEVAGDQAKCTTEPAVPYPRRDQAARPHPPSLAQVQQQRRPRKPGPPHCLRRHRQRRRTRRLLDRSPTVSLYLKVYFVGSHGRTGSSCTASSVSAPTSPPRRSSATSPRLRPRSAGPNGRRRPSAKFHRRRPT